MKSQFIKDVVSMLKTDDVKKEFNEISKLVVDFILTKLNPYMYIIITIVVVIFLMNLANLILIVIMFRKKRISLTIDK